MNDSSKRMITLFDYTLNPQVKGEFYPAENKLNTPVFESKTVDDVKPEAVSVPLPLVAETKIAPKAESDSVKWAKQKYAPTSKKGFSFSKALVVFFLAVAMYGFSTLAMPIIIAEASFRISQYTAEPKTMAGTISAPRVKALDPEIATQFKIVVPKINLESRVVENVDPTDEVAYKDALTKGIAQARGSYLPGEAGSIFLFAHSTNDISNILAYNAKFYAVKDLNPGDEVVIFYHGRKYTYIIERRQVINPSDLDAIRNSNADLIMSTCYPPGTDWQRLITFANLVEVTQ